MKLFCLTVILFLPYYSNSQTDTLNQLNANGKKNGFWVQYLDKRCRPTDSTNATFLGLEFYDNGFGVFKFHKYKWKSKDSLVYEGAAIQVSKPILLDGTFKWYNRKTKNQTAEEVYRNGHPIYIKSFSSPSKDNNYTSRLFEDLDFTKKYNNITGTYFLQEHSPVSDKVNQYWYRKGDKGWKSYPVKRQ